jgi:Protein of unknown function (DUF3570)
VYFTVPKLSHTCRLISPALLASSASSVVAADWQPIVQEWLPLHQSYDYGFQSYKEDGDRINIESHYIRGNIEINEENSVRFQWLMDTVSGSSPNGELDDNGNVTEIKLHEDVRIGILGALSHKFGDHTVEFEISQSDEHDYLSNGYALSDAWDLNQKNTTLSYGVNYLDDDVVVPLDGKQKKRAADFFTGVSQVIDKDTIVSANLTVGYSEGYLNDPYKVIQRHEIITVPDGGGGFIDVPVTNTYNENRPDNRLREVLQFNALRYIEPASAALNATLRLSHDDYDVNSGTLQLEWRQSIGSRFELTPYTRYYRQSAASFYMRNLDNVNIGTPADFPDGSGPNYSADYRLSSLSTFSLGLKANYKVSDNFSVNAAYERYEMQGTGSDKAPSAAYPNANIWTFAVKLDF